MGLWLQWLAATAIGWAAGEAVASFVPEDTIVLGTIHTAVIGSCPGTMQWLILRRHIEMAGRWVAATVIGSGLGGAVGLAASFAAGATVIQPWALLPFGVALGVCQWFVLRTQFAGSGWWTLAYALGLPLSFVIGLIASFSIGFEWENVDAIFRVVSLASSGPSRGGMKPEVTELRRKRTGHTAVCDKPIYWSKNSEHSRNVLPHSRALGHGRRASLRRPKKRTRHRG